ncbi:thiolase-like protein [Ostreococcus tauri]|nr:thiolase-like protein [Ostreococcus tauri]
MLPSSSLATARAARVVVVRERALGRSSASRASVVNQRGRATTTRTSVRASASFSTAGARISGTGKALPEKYLTNDDLSRLVETNDEWITARTGIRKRHVISGDETLTSLCAKAAMQALDRANVKAEDVDLIILATSSPDDIFGSACTVQAAIGAKKALAFDLTAACSGFVIGLVNGAQYIRAGGFKNVLVIGGDVLSRYVDWRDRGTCILFGDGAGAVVLTATDADACSLKGFDMHSDGSQNHHLIAQYMGEKGKPMSEGASSSASFCNISMNGQDVFKFAVRTVPMTVNKSLEAAGMSAEDIDKLVLHQANQRIIDSAAQRFGLTEDKVVSNIAEYGNTSAGSVPIALCEAVEQGAIKTDDVIAFAGFGAGLTWASCIWKF